MVLTDAVCTFDEPPIWSLLAHACLGASRNQQALTALQNVDCTPSTHVENARLRMLALERLRRTNDAIGLARQVLEHHPHDRFATEALGRLTDPANLPHRSAVDPFYTVARAEQYVEIGRVDRALRIYRRILLNHPGDAALAARIDVLMAQRSAEEPDLAETLPPPAAALSEGLPTPGGPSLFADDEVIDDSEDAPTVQMLGSDEPGLETFRRFPSVRGDA